MYQWFFWWGCWWWQWCDLKREGKLLVSCFFTPLSLSLSLCTLTRCSLYSPRHHHTKHAHVKVFTLRILDLAGWIHVCRVSRSGGLAYQMRERGRESSQSNGRFTQCAHLLKEKSNETRKPLLVMLFSTHQWFMRWTQCIFDRQPSALFLSLTLCCRGPWLSFLPTCESK